MIEFVEVGDSGRLNLTSLAGPAALGSLMHFQGIVGIDEKLQIGRVDPVDDDETISFSLRIDVPAVVISVVDNADSNIHGREILLAQLERVFFAFSQTREGYHEFELRLMGFQVDNHVQHSIHPVLVSALLWMSSSGFSIPIVSFTNIPSCCTMPDLLPAN